MRIHHLLVISLALSVVTVLTNCKDRQSQHPSGGRDHFESNGTATRSSSGDRTKGGSSEPTAPAITALEASATVEPVSVVMAQRKTDKCETASQQFEKLLHSIGVVGKPVGEVVRIFGKPDLQEANKMIYRFDAGFGGWDWNLYHKNNVITSFARTGVN